MAYILTDLISRVINDKLDDDSFDAETVQRFLNDTQRDLFNTFELPFMEKVFSGVLPSNNYIFIYPDDMQRLQSVKITDPDGFQRDISNQYVDFRTFNKMYPTPATNEPGPIVWWTNYGGKMYSQAPLDQAYTMEVYYIKRPTELTDGNDVPELPPEFEEALVLGAFKRVLERNEDYDLASAIGNQYQDQMDKLVDRYGFRQSAKTTVMKLPNVRAKIARRR